MTATTTTPTATTLPEEIEREVQRLLKAGEHAAAAAALRHHQQPQRAAKLYEQIFELPLALKCFELAGDVVAAVRVAIVVNDAAALHQPGWRWAFGSSVWWACGR